MNWNLALHTMISFLTNTNQQHYSGQAQLSYLSQTAGIVTLQVLKTHKQDTHYLRILLGKLRAHLGDGAANPRYIATESGVGLRFIGTIPELAKTILVESRTVP